MVLNGMDLAAAFDMVLDPVVALETLISLGFHRVLTSGCDTSALEGLPLIKRLVEQVSHFLKRNFQGLSLCVLEKSGDHRKEDRGA